MAVDPEEYAATSVRLADLLVRQMGAKGADLPSALRYVGRDLPRPVRQAGARIADIGTRVGNPKLARMVDADALATDVALVERHLKRLDPSARKARVRANFAAGLALQIIVLIALVVVVLRWRGLV